MMTEPAHFEALYPPSTPSIPWLVHVPHSSTAIPAEFREQLAPNDSELASELLLLTDRYTDEFARGAAAYGGTLFVNRLSRLVMDPERFPDDADEPMAKLGMGAIYLSRQDGSPLRRPDFSDGERTTLTRELYQPYHGALEQIVGRHLQRCGCCLIVDLHSFPSKSLPYEDPELARPSICIGFDPDHDDPVLRSRWRAVADRAELDLGFNTPFSGSLVPSRFHRRDPRVRSLMIEVRRDLYMDEATGERLPSFAEIRTLVTTLLELAARRAEELVVSSDPSGLPGKA